MDSTGVPAAPQITAALARLRGVGAPVAKSLALSLPSVQPSPARSTARVLLGAGVGPLPS